MTPPNLIIDGHNLIGQMPGMSLRDMDDETHLVKLLQIYARTRRKRIEVYFDGAPPGQAGSRSVGTIQVVSVPLGKTADSAIRERLEALGKQARNLSVVTSDRQVQKEAKTHGAAVIPSPTFATDLLFAAQSTEATQDPARSGRNTAKSKRTPNESGPRLSEKELQEWLDLFSGKKKKP